MSLFAAVAAYGFEPISQVVSDNWPTALNAGLIGRWEITNNNSWPGSGSIIYNLSTSSVYSVSSASIVNGFSTDTTNGLVLNGSSSRVDFGVLSTYNSGSYNLNDAITSTNELTFAFLCNFTSSGGTQQVGLSAWNDYFADTGQSKYLTLFERNNASGQLERNLQTNTGANAGTANSFIVDNSTKFYGTRVKFVTNGWQYWVGTANSFTLTPGGGATSFSTNPLVSRNSPWTFGTRGTTTLNGFQNYMKGNFYAAYMWNRSLTNQEMTDLQTYTNTYVKSNS